MPRWMRYLVSVSSGLMTYFIFVVLVAGIATATGEDRESLGTGMAILAALGSFFIPAVVILLINDWIADRYPVSPREQVERPERVEP
jgi:purine-cytosine permease-like protein